MTQRSWIHSTFSCALATAFLAAMVPGCGGSGGDSETSGGGSGAADEDRWSELATDQEQNTPVGGTTSRSEDGRFSIESSTGGLPGAPVNGDAVTTPSGLQYYVLTEGEGAPPKSMSEFVRVDYSGYLTDGRRFDTTEGAQPATFPLNGVVRGFGEGVSTMKVGEKRKLVIPGPLGYGPQQRPTPSGVTIPANATLVFDVELLDIVDYVNDPAIWPGAEVTRAWTNLESGVRFTQIEVGDGEGAVVEDSAAQVHMEAWLTTGDQFLNTHNPDAEPTTLYLPTIPPGWAEALIGMKPGGKRKLVLPASEAFGPEGDPQLGVPAGATVITDIELIAIDPYVSTPAQLPGDEVAGGPVTLDSGTSYYVLAEGEGDEVAQDNSVVTVEMHAWLNDGTEITAAAPEEETEALLSQMFPGVHEAMLGMKIGGKRKIIVPYDQGAGPRGNAPVIPPKATIIFDIDLLDLDRYAPLPETLPGEAVTGDPVELESGVKYWVLEAGEGDEVLDDSGVRLRLNGYLNNGTEFTQSDEPMYALRTQVFPGLAEAMLGAKVGEKRKVLLPWDLAGGEPGNPQGGIPPKASMVLDIEIVELDPFIEAPARLPGVDIRGLPTRRESGVTTYDLTPGTGAAMTPEIQTVQVRISTYLPDGSRVQGLTTGDQVSSLPMSVAPPGLREGMQGMQVGGTRKVVIPWEQGYGLEGNLQLGVPAKAMLIVDVDLVGIVPPLAQPQAPPGGDGAGDAPVGLPDAAGAPGGDGGAADPGDSGNPPDDQSDDDTGGADG